MTAPDQRRARDGVDLRILRAAVFTAVCVALSAAGHALASCEVLPLWALGVAFLSVFAVAVPFTGRERALPGIAAVLAVGQTALHTLFGFAQGGTEAAVGVVGASSASAVSASAVSDSALVERAARLVCGAGVAAISPAQAQQILSSAGLEPAHSLHHHSAAASTPTGSASALLPSLPMLLGHVLAAVAAGWLLRRGDIALGHLLRLSAHGVAEVSRVRSLRRAFALVRALLAGLRAAPDAGPRAPRTALLLPAKPRISALQHTVIRRGPPSTAAFLLAA
ncbi:hypothetical protein [Streptomyces himalayensis]|uniref:Integral membrane protein n=1 Tax=Streptomyces himalayensis subsp. himalayensis TaxID=2756131 RepID=A0A7W0DHZ3_9ACTN|nr:hypothetical protein [Streptomyces himalayensis]MBA2945449.1 hypothetical protein [Streptomyces himalayensis subsp. himalayensis]